MPSRFKYNCELIKKRYLCGTEYLLTIYISYLVAYVNTFTSHLVYRTGMSTRLLMLVQTFNRLNCKRSTDRSIGTFNSTQCTTYYQATTNNSPRGRRPTTPRHPFNIISSMWAFIVNRYMNICRRYDDRRRCRPQLAVPYITSNSTLYCLNGTIKCTVKDTTTTVSRQIDIFSDF